MTLSSALGNAERLLKCKGYDCTLINKTVENNGNSFYHIISKYLWEDRGHPKKTRRRICTFQSDNISRYILYQPQNENIPISQSPEDSFSVNLKRTKTNFSNPCPRDLFAASELLKTTIVLLIYHDDRREFERKEFPFKQCEMDDTVYLLQIPTTDKDFYVELEMSETFVDTNDRYNHAFCHERQYMKSFSDYSQALAGSSGDGGTVHVKERKLIGVKKDKRSLFRCISMAIYGTQDLYPHVMNLSLQQEEVEEYMGIYAGIHVNNKQCRPEDEKKVLRTHLAGVRSGEKNSEICEIYAVASILQTDVFVLHNFKGCLEWRVYHPVASLQQSNSFITLYAKPSRTSEKDEIYYKLLLPKHSACSCSISPPRVFSCIQQIENELPELSKEILAKRPVCCQGHKGHHLHLLHNLPRVQTKELANSNLPLDESIVKKLEEENRKLELTISLTFDQCIHKEIQGTEMEDCGQFRVPAAKKIIDKANELQIPIFILRANGSWTRYMPGTIKSSEANPQEPCRYYITLFLDEANKYFSRIIPVEGCNCQMVPPLIESNHQSQSEVGPSISRPQRHFPMIEYFNDKTTDDMDDMEFNEVRKEHQFEDCDELEDIIHRSDMENRDIDIVNHLSDNFFSCLSKEIFGVEQHYDFIYDCICDELLNHPKEYGPFFRDTLNNEEDLMDIHIRGVKRKFQVQDVDIIAAATFFQTPIFILTMDTDGSSRWKEYTQVRLIPRPKDFPKRISKCRQLNKADGYHVTLLLDLSGRYHRIVPRHEACNCRIPMPIVPGEVPGSAYVVRTENENNFKIEYRRLRTATRKVKSSLKIWKDICNELIEICEVVSDKVTLYRRGVNTASIAGGGVGLVGGTLAIVGIALAPFTLGAGLGLTIAGGVIGFAGSSTMIGGQVAEAVLFKKALKDFEILVKLFEIITDQLQKDMEELKMSVDELHRVYESFHKMSFKGKDQMVFEPTPVSIRCGMNLHFVPVIVIRITFRSLSLALGIVAAGLSMILDIGIIAYSVHNMLKGNKTKVKEELDKVLNELKFNKSILHTWEYGNEMDVTI